jgi:hypothetical protein
MESMVRTTAGPRIQVDNLLAGPGYLTTLRIPLLRGRDFSTFEPRRCGAGEKRRLVVAVYAAVMSGVFAGAEARMGAFARNEIIKGKPFPLEKLMRLIAQNYGVTSLETLLSRHLDLTLNGSQCVRR